MNILGLLDELRAIAQLGLNYTQDPYDRERYQRLLQLASGQYSEISGLSEAQVQERFSKELGHVTPKVGVSAAIFNDEGQLLLVRRTDDGLLCLPCGWAEVGESPQESIQREVREETGLEVIAGDLSYMGSRKPGDFGLPHTSVHLQFVCQVVGGTIQDSHETQDVGYYDVQQLEQWHRDHQLEVSAALRYWQAISA